MAHTENQTTPRIIKLPAVIAKVGKSRASIYRDMANNAFPKALALGERSRGWLESEIDSWIASRTTAPQSNK